MRALTDGARAMLLAVTCVAMVACGTGPVVHTAQIPATGDRQDARVVGYLAREAFPDGAAWIAPPPLPGSSAFAADEAVATQALALHGSARWRQAMLDADLDVPRAAGLYACALGAPIDASDTPHLHTLLQRSLVDAAIAGAAAKQHYQRPRPFMHNGQATCTPADEEGLARSGSYPSGHAAIGWTWSLILAELAPDRATALLRRGLDFGESRLVCNVHWQSDVDAGRDVGGATVALLHSDPGFRADLEAAKREITQARARGERPHGDCAAEAAALARGLQAPR